MTSYTEFHENPINGIATSNKPHIDIKRVSVIDSYYSYTSVCSSQRDVPLKNTDSKPAMFPAGERVSHLVLTELLWE